MSTGLRFSTVVLGITLFAGCAQTTPATSDTTAVAAAATPDAAADEQAIRAINPSWFKAHQSGDVDALVAHYSDDAVVSPPNSAPARGAAAVRDLFVREIRDMTAAGLTQSSGPNPEFGLSGDLGYEWNTYTVTDKSGKTVDTGKYLSVFAKRNGKWVIIRDIWNSDMPASPAT